MKKKRHFFKLGQFQLWVDRLLSDSIFKQIGLLSAFILLFLGIFCLIGGVIPGAYTPEQPSVSGSNMLVDNHKTGLFYDVLYLMIDPGSTTAPMHPWYAFFIALLGLVLFVGCFISVLSNYFNNRVDKYNSGDTNYPLKDHVLILGFDRSVVSLIKSIIKQTGDNIRVKKDCYILIVTDLNAEIVSRELLQLSPKERKRVIIHRGSRNTKSDLESLYIDLCHSIYIIGEEKEKGHDDISLEAVKRISEILEPEVKANQNYKPKKCYIKFDSQTALLAANTIGIYGMAKVDDNYTLRLYPYNIYDVWAQKLLIPEKGEQERVANNNGYIEEGSIKYKPIDTEDGINQESKKHVHIVISEMSEMGMAIAHQVAQTAHYPNFNRESVSPLRTRITFVQKDIAYKMHQFQNRYEQLFSIVLWRFIKEQSESNQTISTNADIWNDGFSSNDYSYLGKNFLDLEFEFINDDISSPMVRDYLISESQDPDVLLTMILADKDQNDNFDKALSLPMIVKTNAKQILVYQPFSSASIHQLGKKKENKTDDKNPKDLYEIKPFGMYNQMYGTVLIPEKSGQLLHLRYKEVEIPDNPEKRSERDRQKLWTQAKDEWNKSTKSSRWSNISASNICYTYLRSAGVYNNSDYSLMKSSLKRSENALENVEHTRWMTFNLIAGFRPMTRKENEKLNSLDSLQKKKDYYNERKNNYAHGCIRNSTMIDNEFKEIAGLLDDNKKSKDNDIKFIRAIPNVLQTVEIEVNK